VRGLRRLIFVLVVVGLLAGIPLSAVASESILSGNVRQADAAFNQSLVAAVRGGLDQGAADTMMWRYTQVSAIKSSAWWQAPIADHNKLDELNQLSAELDATYQQQVTDSRDALQRELHHWDQMLSDAQNAGVSADGLDASTARFASYAALATTPNALVALSSVVSDQYSILDGRMAAYRTARDQVDAAAQNAKTLLAGAGQYPQLSLTGFAAQIGAATDSLPSVHSAEAFGPILAQLQQTAAGIQGLLNARTNAYNQLADTRSTLAAAQSIGAALGNHPSTISYLAGQLPGGCTRRTWPPILYSTSQPSVPSSSCTRMARSRPRSWRAPASTAALSQESFHSWRSSSSSLVSRLLHGRMRS